MSEKSVVIVGAGPGVGYETAERFARDGYSVGLVRRDIQQAESFAQSLRARGTRIFALSADAGNPRELSAAVTQLAEQLGRIDVLLYNVPGPLGDAYGPTLDIDLSALQNFLTLRVVSALASVQAARPHLEESGGAVLLTSGQSDRNAYPGTGLIGPPQAALRLLAEHLHAEFDQHGVFVGYLPLDNPPLYSDPELESRRADLPAGFSLDERVVASDVAEAIFRLQLARDRFESPVKSTWTAS